MKGKKKLRVSTQGYKADSPDRNRSMNIIPGGNITMQNVPHNVMMMPYSHEEGFMGNTVGTPGNSYNFKGADYTFEVPMKQKGGQPSKAKAKEILHDKTAHGHPLTDAQRKYFGWIASRQQGGEIPTDFSQMNPFNEDGNFNYDLSSEIQIPDMFTDANENYEYDSPEQQQMMQMGGSPRYPSLTTGKKNSNTVQISYGQQKFIPHSDYYSYDPNKKTYSPSDSLTKRRESSGISNNMFISEADMPPQQKMQLGFVQDSTGSWVDPVTSQYFKFFPARYKGVALQSGTAGFPKVFRPTDKDYEIISDPLGGSVNFKAGGQSTSFLKNMFKKFGGDIDPDGKNTTEYISAKKDIFSDFLAKNAFKDMMREDTEKVNQYKAQMGKTMPPWEISPADIPWDENYTPDLSQFRETVPGEGGDVVVPNMENQSIQERQRNMRDAIDPNAWRGPQPNAQNAAINSPDTLNLPPKKQLNRQVLASIIPAGINTVASLFERSDVKNRQRQMNQRTNANAVFNPTSYKNASRGDYEINTGVFRPNNLVPTQFQGFNMGDRNQQSSFKTGGEYKEGGTYMMSAADIKRLKDLGYEIEVED